MKQMEEDRIVRGAVSRYGRIRRLGFQTRGFYVIAVSKNIKNGLIRGA